MATNAINLKRDNYKPVVDPVDDLRALLSSAIRGHVSAEIALLHIMKVYDFSISSLQQILNEDHINISFSNVHYKDIAPFVGLGCNFGMDDIKPFDLYRSRIPTAIFKSIVKDIDGMMLRYGPPIKHQTVGITSQFLSPIFNHLIALFGSAFRDEPESIIEDCISTKPRIVHYFKMIGLTSVLFIEVRFEIGNYTERLDAIAQVIAECNACDWGNRQEDFCMPVYGILCDGNIFEFFLFDGTTNPYSFKYGLSPNHPQTYRRTFQLPDPAGLLTTHPFINALRPICEVIFDVLLSSYISSLKAYFVSFSKSIGGGQPRESLDKWEKAISAAVKASEGFRNAEMKRQTQFTDAANSLTEEAIVSLEHSVDAIPILYRSELFMSSWDDSEIEKV